ncbi:peptidase M42 [Alicyclobacillus acidiphilus]|uniref:peptidase M42 n=1 Tax=Alicyclobacillus acidiphilus TaxID=182455 RepID=UPI00082AA864|nr:peptidase M42 [Alicyclobacillus acidiphilus]
MKELIFRLAMEIAPSGSERPLAEALIGELATAADEVHIDVLGNAIATKQGYGPHMMLVAHMDEPGVMVIDIDDDGFLRLIPIGNLTASELVGRQVNFVNGTVGLIQSEVDLKSTESYDHLFVDIGANSREAALEKVYIGLAGAVGAEIQELTETKLVGRALDNRVGCAIVVQAFQELANAGRRVTAVFTAQSEPGARAAQAAAYQVRPDLGIVIDAALASDVPKGKGTSLRIGAGPAIKIMDATTIVPAEVKNLFQLTAERLGIAYQHEVWPKGRTDVGAVQLMGSGVRVGGLSYPARYVGHCETVVDLTDADSVCRLAVASAMAFSDGI